MQHHATHPFTSTALACGLGCVSHGRYELAYIESTQGVARGQRVWQLAFGSGFKFNSAVLQALRPIREQHAAWDNFNSEVGHRLWAWSLRQLRQVRIPQETGRSIMLHRRHCCLGPQPISGPLLLSSVYSF
jgi:hypothetical protein